MNRPTSVIVIAILQFVFGGLGLLGAACTSVAVAVGPEAFMVQGNDPKLQEINAATKQRLEVTNKYMDDKAPWHHVYTKVMLGLSFVIPVLMIVGGIGLLQMKPWGRWTTIAYGFLSIAITLVGVAFTMLVGVPAQQEAFHQVPAKNPMEETTAAMTGYTQVGCPLILVLYPVIVLVIMFLPSVAAAFTGTGPTRDPEPEEQSGWAEH